MGCHHYGTGWCSQLFLLGRCEVHPWCFRSRSFPWVGTTDGFFDHPKTLTISADSLVYYLTFWYKSDERSVRVASILASATLAGAFGGAIAYGIGHMNGASGLSAWRWLFIIEGAPSCVSSLFVLFFLPDYPEEYLKGREREISLARLKVEGSKSHHRSMTWQDAKTTLTDWRLYGHYLIYFGISVPFSSLSLFTPSITAGLGYKDLRAQLMSVPPYAVAYG